MGAIQEAIARLPKPVTPQDLYLFLYLATGENIPHKAVCRDHQTPWDMTVKAFFNQSGSILGIGNRKGSKTRSVAKLVLAELKFIDGVEIASVGAIEKQANKCFRYVDSFLKRACPDEVVKALRSETRLTNGSSYEQLVGTISGVNCLVGSTLIDCPRDLDKYPKGVPIQELVGQEIHTYGYDIGNDRFGLYKAKNIRKTGSSVPVFKVTFSWKTPGSGKSHVESVTGTQEHPMLLKSGEYKPLGELKPGDSLQPFYSGLYTVDSLRFGKDKLPGRWVRSSKNKYPDEHRFVCSELFGDIPPGVEVHHLNHNHQDNTPSNLVLMTKEDHHIHHFGSDYQAHITELSLKKMSMSKTKNKVFPVWQNKAFLEAEIAKGKSLRQIDRELGTSAVEKWAKIFGLKSKQQLLLEEQHQAKCLRVEAAKTRVATDKRSVYYKAPYKDREWLSAEVLTGKSPAEIAANCAVLTETIQEWLDKFSIPWQKLSPSSQQVRDKIRAATLRRYQDPEQRKASSETAKRRANTPEYRAYLSQMQRNRWAKHNACKTADMAVDGNHKVVSVEFAGYEDVYDMEVDVVHNFIANGVVVHNSPHPHRLRADEVELMKREVLEELLLVPTSDEERGIPRSTILTSTRKYTYGVVQSIIDDPDSDFEVLIWCYKEVSQPCKESRRGSGKRKYIIKDHHNTDETGAPAEKEIIAWSNCGSCALLPSCRGDLAYSEGYLPIDDLIKDFKSVNINTWIQQMECRKASTAGKVYPQFDEAVHTDLFQYNANYPLDISVDFGHQNPTCVGFWQENEDTGQVWMIDEIYESGLTTDRLAEKIKHKLDKWRLSPDDIRYGIGDSAQAQQIADLTGYNIHLEPVNKGSLQAGLDKVRRYLSSLAHGARIKIHKNNCPHTIKEMKNYHYKRTSVLGVITEEPVKKDDHSMDQLRYYITHIESMSNPGLVLID